MSNPSKPTRHGAQTRRAHAAAYPRMDSPMSAAAPPMPADEIACRRELKRLGVA